MGWKPRGINACYSFECRSFCVDEQAVPLSKPEAELYRSIVQKLIYICKRARPDIDPALSSLSTRVTNPTKDCQKKLYRVLDFLKNTLEDDQVIGASNLGKVYMWVDASFAVHHNMQSHTGGTMSFRTGIIHTKSSKQKLNTRKSTEVELVAVSNFLPYHIWMGNFMKSQGYALKKKILFQDNQSAIKME